MSVWKENANKNLLAKSVEKNDFEIAKLEWLFNGTYIDYGSDDEICQLCEHESLRYHFGITNIKNKNELLVGSSCIDLFDIGIVYNGEIIRGDLRNKQIEKMKNDFKKLSSYERVIEYLEQLKAVNNHGAINTWMSEWIRFRSFQPKSMAHVGWLLDKYSIPHNVKDFKVTIKRSIHKQLILEMDDLRYKRLRYYLSNQQRKIWDNEKGYI